jgi:hypothetical protein
MLFCVFFLVLDEERKSGLNAFLYGCVENSMKKQMKERGV